MELKLVNGDYVPDGTGGLCRLSGAEEVLGRAIYRLTARRGRFPFLPELGSRIHEIMREQPSARQTLAARYVAEALKEESGLKVTDVEWQDQEGGARLTAYLEWQGETLSVTVKV